MPCNIKKLSTIEKGLHYSKILSSSTFKKFVNNVSVITNTPGYYNHLDCEKRRWPNIFSVTKVDKIDFKSIQTENII